MAKLSVIEFLISFVLLSIASDLYNEIAEPGQFPFQVYIFVITYDDRVALCGGSIISPNFILTAAHCCILQKEFEIGIGTTFLGLPMFRRRTSERIIHSEYEPETFKNDIALIPVRRIQFNTYVQPIPLPSSSNALETYTDEKVIISGWGRTAENTIPRSMQYKTFRVISNSECDESYYYVFNSTLCGTRWDDFGLQLSCKGDSGGPLSHTTPNGTKQIGIVSFGASAGCDKGYPVAFTRITSYLDWLSQVTGIILE